MTNLPSVQAFWYARQSRILLLTRLYSTITMLRLRSKGVQVGHGLNVYGWVNLSIHPTSTVFLGNEIRLNSSFARNAVGAYQKLGLQINAQAHLEIGDRVGISNTTIVCAKQIVIEADVMIGGGCALYDTDFHLLDPERRHQKPQDERAATAPIIIGKNSFIGGHSIILKGVTIGEGAIIGAGSVVTRNVPSYEIWAGNPIRHIRSLRE